MASNAQYEPIPLEKLAACEPPFLLTVAAAAQTLSLSRSMVYELVYKGLLPSVKIGKSRRISAKALYEYIEHLESEAGT